MRLQSLALIPHFLLILLHVPAAFNGTKQSSPVVTIKNLEAVGRDPAYIDPLLTCRLWKDQKKQTGAEKADRLELLFGPES